MILEELKQTDAVFLHDLLNLSHESQMVPFSIEISKLVAERRLGSSCVTVDHVLKAVCIAEEVCIFDLIVLVTVDQCDGIDLILIDLESKCVQHLSEDLRADLKVAKCVSVLEEALCVQSILSDNFTEVLNDLLAQFSLFCFCLAPSVDCLCADITDGNIEVLFEAFLGEYFVDTVGEISPLDVLALLRCLEHTLKHFKFACRDRAFGHIKSNSELLRRYKARSEPVKVTEELRDTDALLFAELADASNDIVLIIRRISYNLCLADTCLRLGEVISAVVETLVDTEELLGAIDVLTEVNIVHLVNIALVHITTQ